MIPRSPRRLPNNRLELTSSKPLPALEQDVRPGPDPLFFEEIGRIGDRKSSRAPTFVALPGSGGDLPGLFPSNPRKPFLNRR
jgi:hypothetical protein